MSDANCQGRWDLFDSTAQRAHWTARQLCATCPLLAPCAARRDELLKDRAFAKHARGTWAGMLLDPVDIQALKRLRERRRYAEKKAAQERVA